MANHRADEHPRPAPGGHRPAHGRHFGSLPWSAALVGAAVALSLLGTAGVPGDGPAPAGSGSAKWGVPASVLDASGSVGRGEAASVAQRALSRDSERSALADAAGQRLQRAGQAQGRQRHAALAKLAASAQKQANKMALNGWQLPVAAGRYELTARFGECFGLWVHCHTGLDFAAPTGTPIHAVAMGVITKTGWAGPYGYRTEETLPDGTQLWYCHQNFIPVHDGLHVVAGQVIGYIGSTGNTTGPHLHLEVRPGGGDPVDPYAALVAHGLSP